MEKTLVPQGTVSETETDIMEIIHPYQPDDGHKGTFFILRIAGMEQGTALRLINRKYRSWQNWRATDVDFKRIDEMIPVLARRFGGEARVMRTALLDIHIVETGIGIFRRILHKQPVTDGMWAYAVKMAGLRVPMMVGHQDSNNPWQSLANSIKTTMASRDVLITQEPDGTQHIRAREVVIEPSPEQKQTANSIVQEMLMRAGAQS